jgi:TusA-related sulfurtransferase
MNTTSSASLPTVTLDMSGAVCPLPLLGAKRILDDLPDGRSMVLISDCPGTADDLEAWAGVTGHEVLQRRPLDARRIAFTICRKAGAGRNPSGVVLDQRGSVCPGPILEAKRQLDRMPAGEVLVLLSDCVVSPSDVAVWSEHTSVELLDVFRNRAGHFEFYLRRRSTMEIV